MPDDSIARLVASLREEEAATVEEAERQLLEAGAAAVPALVELLSDPSAAARRRAASLLGRLGDRRALPALERMAREDAGDYSNYLYMEMVFAVGWDAWFAASRIRKTAGVDREDIARLIRSLSEPEDPRIVEEATVGALVEIGPPAIDQLVEASRTAPAGVRVKVARALGRIVDRRVVAPLEALLEDPDAAVRAEAARALSLGGANRLSS